MFALVQNYPNTVVIILYVLGAGALAAVLYRAHHQKS
jgi:hypothetical protein